MSTVGEILIEARKQKNLSLEQVERETRIRKKILEKLEKSDWGAFAPTYAKGLLRNYSAYLGLDQSRVLAFFRREYDEKKQKIESRQLTKIRPKFRLTPALVSGLVVILLILVVLGYLFYQYRSFTAAPSLEIQEPQNNEKVAGSDVSVVGRTPEDSILKINGEQVQVSPGGTFSILVNLKDGINILTVTSANQFGKISTEKRTVFVQGTADSPGEREQNGKLVSLELKIVERPVFLTIVIDGKTSFEGLMLSESEKKFQAKETIKVTSDDAGATEIKIGSKEFFLGKDSEKVERVFSESDL